MTLQQNPAEKVGFTWFLSTKASLDDGSSAFQWQLSLNGLEKVIGDGLNGLDG